MTLTRRQILTGGAAAGVGLAVAGTMPSLGAGTVAAAPSSFPSNGRPNDGRRTSVPAAAGRPERHPGPAARASRTRSPARSARPTCSFGQGKTPDFHDGTAVVGADRRSITLIQNHEMTPNIVGLRRAPRGRDGVRPRRRSTPAAAPC